MLQLRKNFSVRRSGSWIRLHRRLRAFLRSSGKGQQLKGSEGTLWGVLNAVLEYVDHHSKTDQTRLAYSLLGDGMDLKVRAYRAVQEELKKAA